MCVKNLSTSVFANSLRSRVLECNTDFVISQSKLLPTIVIAMLTYLQQELMSDSRISFKDACNQLECHDLSNLEIIPVKLSVNDTVEEYSLVKPIQILYMDPSDVAPYYPFFHPLIEEAYGILNLLLQIGVQMSLDFSHIKYIFKSIKDEFQENEVDLKKNQVTFELLFATRG